MTINGYIDQGNYDPRAQSQHFTHARSGTALMTFNLDDVQATLGAPTEISIALPASREA